MKITDLEILPINRYLFLKIHTDAGITGLGESGTWGYLQASASVMESYRDYLVGKDPLLIEHHWQNLYRGTHFRGAAIMGAISAIDIALWDIAGKHFDVPVYQLLGGKVRDKARVYYHVKGDTKEKLIQGCVDAKKQGFVPDASVAGDEVENGARPKPFMVYRNLDLMDIHPIQAVIKVDDTVSGVGEALEAGCWGVGVARYSNYMDINSMEEAESLPEEEIERRVEKTREILRQTGAHYVIDSITDLEPVIEDINTRLARGESPQG